MKSSESHCANHVTYLPYIIHDSAPPFEHLFYSGRRRSAPPTYCLQHKIEQIVLSTTTMAPSGFRVFPDFRLRRAPLFTIKAITLDCPANVIRFIRSSRREGRTNLICFSLPRIGVGQMPIAAVAHTAAAIGQWVSFEYLEELLHWSVISCQETIFLFNPCSIPVHSSFVHSELHQLLVTA